MDKMAILGIVENQRKNTGIHTTNQPDSKRFPALIEPICQKIKRYPSEENVREFLKMGGDECKR
ncbi:MAG: hypothetical protein P4L87_00740 [Formivibrio sp.]|nr:hypothetical protein [Formivibrio sp.]